ncbi:DUF485 domain-containing protein [Fuchsiella alkaliacetigena]|uniref:DUF485 domain-containing protein n=1 Tax=Fuchsiella alkaliacetigena TaxID=957042 RepID=UPI00200B02AD|nr:DUF485 domain-containing protein [Fuchsiella alkaliacetigena]MCK8825564.1 DUF485 domain-containing protein [Fuchsiella alkaliacetigena]
MSSSKENEALYKKEYITADEIPESPIVDKLIKKQFKFSFSVSFIVLFITFLIPVLNEFAPGFMSTIVFGFELDYFLTAIAIYPFIWITSYLYIKKSNKMEQEELGQVLREKQQQETVEGGA